MGYNQQEQFFQIPLDIEHNSTPVNQTNDSNRRRKKWFTIIICIILAVTGQSIANLLGNYYLLHINQNHPYGKWTQSLLQFAGFPILVLPFLIFLLLSSKKKNQFLIATKGTSLLELAIFYPLIAIFMFFQAYYSNSKENIPFSVFTLIYTTQLLFTAIFSIIFNKIKFNRWMIISLIFAILTGAFTLNTFSLGSPIANPKKHNYQGMAPVPGALLSAFFFSLLICMIRVIFKDLISICNKPTNTKQPRFIVVLELLIATSFFATVFLLTALFISGENHDLKGHMNGFSKGKMAYVRTMVGQSIAWQVYWVGIVGLVLFVSPVFSTVINVCTWPVMSLLVTFVYNKYDEYHVLSGTALATATLSIISYFYLIHKENKNVIVE